MIANATGDGSSNALALLRFDMVEWHTLQYRSIVMLKVNITDPTLPMCASPYLNKEQCTNGMPNVS